MKNGLKGHNSDSTSASIRAFQLHCKVDDGGEGGEEEEEDDEEK